MSRVRLDRNRVLAHWCADLEGAVLAIGTGNDRNGAAGHIRDFFVCADSYETSRVEVAPGHYGAVLCRTLGTSPDVRESLAALDVILKPGGTLILELPFRQAAQSDSPDFWRFTEQAARQLLKDYEDVEIVALDGAGNHEQFPAAYLARGRKPSVTSEPVNVPVSVPDNDQF